MRRTPRISTATSHMQAKRPHFANITLDHPPFRLRTVGSASTSLTCWLGAKGSLARDTNWPARLVEHSSEATEGRTRESKNSTLTTVNHMSSHIEVHKITSTYRRHQDRSQCITQGLRVGLRQGCPQDAIFNFVLTNVDAATPCEYKYFDRGKGDVA